MDILLLYLLFLVPVVVAQFSERHRRSRYATHDPQLNAIIDRGLRYLPYGFLVAINLGLLGVAALALFNQWVMTFMPELAEPQGLVTNWWGVAAACLLTSLLAFLPLVPAARRWLARWLPIDADSFVHTTALAFAVYHIGLSLGQMAMIGDLETLTDVELSLTIWDLILTGIPLMLFALTGVGLLIRRGGRGAMERLGLRRPTWRQVVVAGGVTALLLAFDLGINLLWGEIDPTGYDLLEQVTDNLFGDLMTLGGAITLGLSAGISEELLFRGAVQPRLGLGLSAFLFALGHLQYGLTLAMVEVFIIGLVLGVVRNRANTILCILIHGGYNTAGVLLGMLQP